jgi:hypothetical protein
VRLRIGRLQANDHDRDGSHDPRKIQFKSYARDTVTEEAVCESAK